MARIRTIKPDYWEDEGVAELSRDARLLYIATWNLADDEGILRWTPEYIKSQVFIYDTDMTIKKVGALMAALVGGDYVYAYSGGRSQQRLGLIVRFGQHQRINRPQPSKFPFPSLQSPDVRQMYGRRDQMRCHVCGDPILAGEALGGLKPYSREQVALSIDHVTARAKGGTDAPSNLRAAHLGCNKRKGVSVPDSVNDSMNESMNDAEADAMNESLTEGNGREWKGKGDRRTAATRESSRKPDYLFEALAEVTGVNISEITRPARGSLNNARAELVKVGATPEEVRVRAGEYRRRMPAATLTASALAKHWPTLAPVDPFAERAVTSFEPSAGSR